VLLRAGEVVEGVDLASARRPAARSQRDLARGPARLAAALGLDGGWNGVDAVAAGSPLVVRAGARVASRVRGLDEAVPHAVVRRGPRVGVGGAGAHHPWRFWLDGEPTVSPYRAHAPRRRSPGTNTVAGTDGGRAG
jgi:DNA-3-methyladenine glycosylase